MVGGEVKVATVTSENIDTMATLPISVTRYAQQQGTVEKTEKSASNKDLEAKKSRPHYVYHQLKRTSMFVVLSLLYGKLVVVACIAFVVSKEVTKSLPTRYYEGFFTYLFGVSIVFLLYLFCFLLQDSSCCGGGKSDEKAVKKPPKKDKKKDKKGKDASSEGATQSQGARSRPTLLQREVYPHKIKDRNKTKPETERAIERSIDSIDVEENPNDQSLVVKKGKGTNQSEEKLTEPSPDSIDIEASSSDGEFRKRKTSQNLHHYGSFFLRVGAIGFGLGTMIYIGLQFGKIFEIPFNSPCYELLRALNPVLQMVFTFMQMYFIFMNARLKIHRFKFIARFGLMHVMATNICVWIKTLVFESLNEIDRKPISYFNFTKGIVSTLSTDYDLMERSKSVLKGATTPRGGFKSYNLEKDFEVGAKTYFEEVGSSVAQVPYALLSDTLNSTTTRLVTTTTASTVTPSTTARILSTLPQIVTSTSTASSTTAQAIVTNTILNSVSTFPSQTTAANATDSAPQLLHAFAEALVGLKQNATVPTYANDSCGRINIMGTIVEDSAPFLYPFIIEYSLIGAAVIYIMWRHIGRYPRYVSEENIEHKLEIMLSQRAVAIAQAQSGSRVDCIGASKGLFFGLLMLVGSLICLLLYFVLIQHEQFSKFAIYLADASHSAVMALSLLAIIIGFCRAKNLRFYAADSTDLNDILLRISAFGLFVYATFSIIAGARYAFIKERNLLVLITGSITIFQVVLQLLFIGDMSKRHVYLPEHDRNKPGRQIVTFLLICNITMWVLFTFESQKVLVNPVQLDFYGHRAWKLVEHLTLPLCIFHRFHSAVALAEIWKNSYKPRIE
ncbi:proton channel OtopLc isoform X2 [Planococcus citri]|uniref:proton channel OtopLc isoform X2 n=1 Tax=Planococcus citri TaxID=170843 RepID=UPI0031F77C51